MPEYGFPLTSIFPYKDRGKRASEKNRFLAYFAQCFSKQLFHRTHPGVSFNDRLSNLRHALFWWVDDYKLRISSLQKMFWDCYFAFSDLLFLPLLLSFKLNFFCLKNVLKMLKIFWKLTREKIYMHNAPKCSVTL